MVKASSSKSVDKEDDLEGSSTSFEKSDLFSSEALELGAETVEPENKEKVLSNESKKLCPRCQKPGSGPYGRWVRNSSGRLYSPYYYFAHRINSKIKWCYISKALIKELDNDNVKEAPG